MNPEFITLLVAPAVAAIIGATCLWLARRELRKTATLVAKMKDELRRQTEANLRRAEELSTESFNGSLPGNVREHASFKQ